ncbi:lytic polysaccharide monooxygenase [Paenibacillus sp. SYP-B3998]|uniref:lytic polysaccharide monooxygenase n=1 Tax=Paenibacillus sp. SYP-B3998 TaxID=2678564 RepID=UPI0031F94EC7
MAFVLILGVAAFTRIFAGNASAHGYLESPASRSSLCQQGQNTNCGQIQYEPQSLEAIGSFPQSGPEDGKIAGAGKYPELYAQTPDRWKKVTMNGGKNTFTWHLTARHATSEWKYYITKKGWDPNKPLARADLDPTPFCYVNDGGAIPGQTVNHECNVPTDRSGYYLILGVWEIADTGNAFYNVIDVNLVNNGTGTDTTAPTSPSNLLATATTSTSVTLGWNASTDNVGVTGYQVYRGTALVATVSGTTLSYTDSGLTANTAYTYSVKAKDAAGNISSASNTISATTTGGTIDTQAPTAPGNLRVTATTSSSLALAWNASTDNVGVTGYQVFRGTALVTTVSGSSLTYTVTGLTASTAYTFTVKASDAAGNLSAASSSLSATTSADTGASAWIVNKAYLAGDLVTYNNVVYECRQPHTSLTGWEPANVPALWQVK